MVFDSAGPRRLPAGRERSEPMKVVIVALNSQYIHLSLAPWYLSAACEAAGLQAETEVLELSVNRQPGEILEEIVRCRPDVAAFPCYIFNRAAVRAAACDLKKLLPGTRVVLGGPEVSYDAARVLESCPGADAVVIGEGETPFVRLLEASAAGKGFEGIPGVACRSGGSVHISPPETPPDFADVPSPYTAQMLEAGKGKILYYESSRGCPFRCSYCLSSLSAGVRRLPLGRVFRELDRLLLSQARQVKFVDRTFNADPRRACAILGHLLESAAAARREGRPYVPNFHFEAAPDLFDEELLALLAGAPAGFFQLEIGIQSFNPRTLEACGRKTDFAKCRANLRKLLAPGNIHIHLDLIAGLPQEDLASFRRSFDEVYALRPHCIQLGFLKLLKGSRMRAQAPQDGVLYRDEPPYEVLQTPWLRFEDLSLLKEVEACVDRLYNSGKFRRCLDYLVAKSGSPFRLFEDFASFLKQSGTSPNGTAQKTLYGLLRRFAFLRLGSPEERTVFNELMKFDFFGSDSSCSPPAEIARVCDGRLRALYSKRAGETKGRVHYEVFAFDPLRFPDGPTEPTVCRFDYGARHPVTGLYAVSAFPARELPGG